MPRHAQPPRLYLRSRAGRASQWVIRDRSREISTGASAGDRCKAETALAEYLQQKHTPDFGRGHPNQVLIADALLEYGKSQSVRIHRPVLIWLAVEKLTQFFTTEMVCAVTGGRCDAYVDWRTAQTDARATRNGRPIKAATAGRELSVLAAALNWCHREGKIDRPVPVKLPPIAEPRQHHLTRSQLAALLAGALGWDANGTRHRTRINRHLARFILLGVYTGTRHDAILKLQWMPNTTGGWVDFDAGVIYRRPQDAIESGKRRPPVPIPPRLLPHLLRWKRHSVRHVVEWRNKPLISKQVRAWRVAREFAGLGPQITPHILRHTFCTWLLQAGVSIWDVAGAAGVTESVIQRTYGHHAREQLRNAVAKLSPPQFCPWNSGTKTEDNAKRRAKTD